MEIPDIFHLPEPRKSRRKLINLVCDGPGCGIIFKQAPSEAKRHKLHFHNRKCHGKWLYQRRISKNKAPKTCTALTVVPEKRENGVVN